jgi:hypothetical protein
MYPSNYYKLLILSIILLLSFNNNSEAQKNTEGRFIIISGDRADMKINPTAVTISGAMMFLMLDDKIVYKAKSDEEGKFHFENIKPGRYLLECKLPGLAAEWTKKAESVKPKKYFVNFAISNTTKGPITSGSKTGEKPSCFDLPEELLLESTINILNGFVLYSVNNYGINDEGLK